jgi:hypothetical protein
MNNNLDSLLPQIYDALTERHLVLFHAEPRDPGLPTGVYWDVDQHPSHEDFLDAASASGAKIVTLYTRRFSEEQLDEALAQLEDSDIDHKDQKILERQLKDLRVYEGRLCNIELAFTHDSREYVFDVHSEWFDEFGDVMDRIETSYLMPEDDSPLDGGYYSRN